MQIDPLALISITVAIVIVVVLTLLPRFGPHYTSRLTCPSCKKTFNFHYVPGASINSLIRKNYRDLKCPYCHRKATYDIAITRVHTPKKQKIKLKA